MERQRKNGLLIILLSVAVLLIFAYQHDIGNPTGMIDFKAHYFPSRTLLHHSDPYNPTAVTREYISEPTNAKDDSLTHVVATHYPYPPILFLLTAWIGAMPYEAARLGWAFLNVGGLVFGGLMTWKVASRSAPEISALLIAVLFVGSESAVSSGNVAALAIGLCVFAIYSFSESKHVIAGCVCMAISLMLKPQDTGIVWAFLLVYGGSFRRRAIGSFVIAAGLAIPSVVWATRMSPQWQQELRHNLSIYTAAGGINDPGPTTGATHGSLVNLQVVFSNIWNKPVFYNAMAISLCAVLLLILMVSATRRQSSISEFWFALAACTALTLLCVYHRRYDAKLELLAIPACAELWAKGGRTGKAALVITGACFVFTSDSAWVFVSQVLAGFRLAPTGLLFRTLEDTFVLFPAPMSLLVMSVFYLWVFMKRTQMSTETDKRQLTPEATI